MEKQNERNINNIKPSNISFKILLLGDATVGKSSLIQRYINNEYSQTYITTIGIEQNRKTLNVNNVQVKLVIWDTAGQEKFRAINKQFYKGTDCVILAFDLNNKKTIININYWMGQLYQENKIENIGIVLVGTKKDLLNDGKDDKVEKSEINDAIERYKIKFFETSSKTGENVKEVFNYLVKLTLSKKNYLELPFTGNLEDYKIIELERGEEKELDQKNLKIIIQKSTKNSTNCC